ncbi:S9 family serine peptidase, partial [Enterococcus faecalis]
TDDEKIPYEDMADFELLVSAKTYARNSQIITEIGERHLVKGETMDMVVDFFKEASKTLET